MKTIQGDLIKLALQGHFDVIVHQCNCFNTMGLGIARQIATQLPEAAIADNYTKRGDANKLGTIGVVEIERKNIKFIVVNAYGQYGCNISKVNADYDALRSCFKEVKKQFSGKRIGFPKISAGLARGNWDIISKIIDEELEGEDYTLVEFKP
jgi:O-acetyl-ADP-ribose deacetylase (regulator of RNase III)